MFRNFVIGHCWPKSAVRHAFGKNHVIIVFRSSPQKFTQKYHHLFHSFIFKKFGKDKFDQTLTTTWLSERSKIQHLSFPQLSLISKFSIFRYVMQQQWVMLRVILFRLTATLLMKNVTMLSTKLQKLWTNVEAPFSTKATQKSIFFT